MTSIDQTGSLSITRIIVPESLDGPAGARFADLVRLGNDVARHDTGHDYLHQEPAEALGFWQDQTDRTSTGFRAERDGRLVGAITMVLSNEEDAATAEFDLMVEPDRWGEGIEEALVAEAEREARARRRLVLQAWTLHRPDPGGERLHPSTKWGSIPAGDRQTAVLLGAGFTLEQVERNSAFELQGPFDHVQAMLEEAVAVAGDEYRAVTWTSPTPERYLDSFAEVLARMSTDAPQGGMEVDEERWDPARVTRRDARLAAQHLLVSVAAVVHRPTGTLVAYNELVIGDARSAATQQYGTLVLTEHRGHRLGTIVKCANRLRWRDLVPESPRVSTFNAEENRPMLDVNEAIGFAPVSYAGAWRKNLS